MSEEVRYIDRPPRLQPELPAHEAAIPPPPDLMQPGYHALMQLAMPLAAVLATVLVAALTQGQGGRSGLLIIPMIMSVVLSSAFAVHNYRREKKEQETAAAAYREQLVNLRQEMAISHDLQRRFYQYNYPPPQVALAIADHSANNHYAGNVQLSERLRLWERRPGDEDFGYLRLGTGAWPSTAAYTAPDIPQLNNPLAREALRLAEVSRFLPDVPITIPLRQPVTNANGHGPLLTHHHAVGIVSDQAQARYGFMRAMLVHYTAFHAPTDAQLLVIGTNQVRDQWRWAFSLPHARMNRGTSNLCFEDDQDRLDKEKSKIAVFLKQLRRILDERRDRLADSTQNPEAVVLPFLLIVVDASDNLPEQSLLRELETDPAITMVLQEGVHLGTAILFLTADRARVPSECLAVIQLDEEQEDRRRVGFRYAEVGVNTERYVGRADLIMQSDVAHRFAQQIEPLMVRKSYGADLPATVELMEMLKIDNLAGLRQYTLENWQKNQLAAHADWLNVAVGMLSGGDIRRLKFAADADGVHGLIAGSTGSGKSELLMTLILGLALRYDPTIINFVLIDFKGGAAFEPFRNLPHCVDIVTNLAGSAVDRMFAAIRAELDRRQALNVVTDSKHIVHYRKRGLHLPPYGQTAVAGDKTYQTQPYPHLFVVIDEFAEMVAENPEYKAQLESITRLGRSLGVTLILAAQRPSGVTDQMRANIKFRICLRVETREESSEVLRRSDAAYLPTGIPGRGYLQIGNENIEMIQVAWSGADYSEEETQENPNVIWLDRSDGRANQDRELPKLYEIAVQILADMAQTYSLPQRKPWPDFLPNSFSLQTAVDVSYFKPDILQLLSHNVGTATDETPGFDSQVKKFALSLNARVTQWLTESGTWPGINWQTEAMLAIVGLVDNPYQAEQMPLVINLPRGHVALFAASGWGKTTFLRTLITSLATNHAPSELHIYVLDFGGRNFSVFRNLPHVGAVITADEDERVQRLLRKLDDELERRKQILGEAGMQDMYAYNQAHPETQMPAILVAIDNFAELKDSYESLLPILTSLVRESRAAGIHFVVTAEQPGVLSGRLYSLMTERLALLLSDPSEYTGIVGRGARGVEEIPGRGFVRVERHALELQLALPAGTPEARYEDELSRLQQLVQTMDEAWQATDQPRPPEIGTLPARVSLQQLLENEPALEQEVRRPQALIALDDLTLAPWYLDLARMGPHFIVLGPPNSGKTTTLRNILLSLAHSYTPEQVMVVLLDFQRRFFNYGGNHTLADLPHVVQTVEQYEQLESLLKNLSNECQHLAMAKNSRSIVVLIDNYEGFAEEVNDEERMRGTTFTTLGRLAREYGTFGLHFVLAGGRDLLRSNEALRKQAQAPRFGFALQSAEIVQDLGGRAPRSMDELPAGRGFIVRSGRSSMLQMATPYQSDETIEADLDTWVAFLKEAHPGKRAVWSKSHE